MSTRKTAGDRKADARTQEVRSAEMKARLLKAAVDILYRRGYAAATTTAVCAAARVSRGAMLHHFPTRVDMMLYVVKAVYEQELVLYRQKLATIEEPEQRREMFPLVLWEVLGRPAGVAVLEIMQGARSDAELSQRLRPLQAEIEGDSIQQAKAMISVIDNLRPDVVRLLVWTIRGLSIAQVLSRSPDEIRASLDTLRRMMDASRRAGVFEVEAGHTAGDEDGAPHRASG